MSKIIDFAFCFTLAIATIFYVLGGGNMLAALAGGILMIILYGIGTIMFSGEKGGKQE